MLNAASKQVKKIRLFAYRPIISLASIIIGGCILFDAEQNKSNKYIVRGVPLTEDEKRLPEVIEFNLKTKLRLVTEESRTSTIIGLLYVSAGSFILFLMILAIWFSLTQFRQFKIQKLESKNESKYTLLISDV